MPVYTESVFLYVLYDIQSCVLNIIRVYEHFCKHRCGGDCRILDDSLGDAGRVLYVTVVNHVDVTQSTMLPPTITYRNCGIVKCNNEKVQIRVSLKVKLPRVHFPENVI